MFKAMVAISLGALAITSGLAFGEESYRPFGVQNDVPVNIVLNGGWELSYQGLYKNVFPSVADLFDQSCGYVMLASKQVNASRFDVLAMIDFDQFRSLFTAQDRTIYANGAQWYKNEFSLGFAGINDVILQGSADTNGLQERDRLSWHTMKIANTDILQLNGGWRSGAHIRLNKSDNWQRIILKSIAPRERNPEHPDECASPVG